MRFALDRSVRRYRDGRVLIGGSPLRLFRLTDAGARLIDRIEAGQAVAAGPAEVRLLDRLIDAGALHLRPERGPFGPDDVTVVVPVRNRAAVLDRLLSSIGAAGAGSRPAAVVVVDDGSLDAAAHAEVARRHGAELVRRPRPGGPGAARHDGIVRSRTDLVAVLDSDCVVTPGWLAALLPQFTDERVAAVAARVRTEPGEGLLARYESARSPLDLGPEPGPVTPGTRVPYVPAAGVVLRRDAYDDVGGFDDSLRVGEDVDLVWRLVESGWRVRYEPSAVVVHDVRPDLRSWLGQRYSYGCSAAPLDARHPGRVAPVSCSPWSVAVWAAAAAGHPVLGATVAFGTSAALAARLGQLPAATSFRLALRGHLGAGRLLARALVRVWWPLALAAAVLSRRARWLLVVAAASAVAEARTRADRVDVDPVRFAVLALADDVAYGCGVWAGCLRARSLRALMPRLVAWPGATDRAAPR
jgi:mycofactocin system glycosyltransferase